MEQLPPELKRDLIVSLGTHRGARRLSPIEVAGALNTALNRGASFSELAGLVRFDSTSTLREIHRLLRLAPEVHHLVGWGKQSPSTLSMTAASQVARLEDHSDQLQAVQAILENDLSSTEARQLIETRIRSQRPIHECTETVLRWRPHVVRKHLLMGAITSDKLSGRLSRMTQAERDELLQSAVTRHLGELPEWSGKLGMSRFALFGGDDFAHAISSAAGGFEAAVNRCLEAEVAHS